MLVEKYKPKSFREIFGQDSVIKEILNWLKNWKKGRTLLLYGKTGSGKTTLVEVIGNEMNYEIVMMDSSDEKTKENIKKVIGSASKNKPFFAKKKIIFIDDVDSISSTDKGGTTEIINIIKESPFPVILTATDAYSPKLRSIRKYCKLVKMNRITSLTIEKILKNICKKEKKKVDERILKIISKNAEGDVRAAINDLEAVISGEDIKNIYRDRERNIFEILRMIFKSRSVNAVREIMRHCDKNFDEIILWLEENIPLEYEKPKEIAKAFEFLSKADLFRSKIIKNQNYRFVMYALNMVAAVSLAKEKTYSKFVSYKPPKRLLMLGDTKPERQKMDLLLKELAEQLHCSKNKIKRDVLPYLKIIYGKN